MEKSLLFTRHSYGCAHMCTYGANHCVEGRFSKFPWVLFTWQHLPNGGYCQVPLGNKPRKDTSVNKPQALHAIPTKGCVYSWWRMACSPGGYTQRDDPLCEIKLIETCGVALLGRRAQLGEDHCGWTQMGDALPSSDTCS